MFLDSMVAVLNSSIFRYKEATDYLHSRGVTDEEIKRYKIGYTKVMNVPDDGTAERKRFMDFSYKGRKFEDKIIFPLFDQTGRVVGIAGRSITTKDFKIFATEEAKFTGFFLGLVHALPEIYKRNRVFVVEGLFDWLALSKVFPNTVGALTAGINDPQYELLMMYCNDLVTAFDGDDTGRRGTEKALERKNVNSMNIGSYKDPARCFEALDLNVGFYKSFIERQMHKISPF